MANVNATYLYFCYLIDIYNLNLNGFEYHDVNVDSQSTIVVKLKKLTEEINSENR